MGVDGVRHAKRSDLKKIILVGNRANGNGSIYGIPPGFKKA